MANFSFSRLSVVAPFAATWREARSAVDSQDVLVNARNQRLLARLWRARRWWRAREASTIASRSRGWCRCRSWLRWSIRSWGAAVRVALVFGPEKHGLNAG